MKVVFASNYFAADGNLYLKGDDYVLPTDMFDVLPLGTVVDGEKKTKDSKAPKKASGQASLPLTSDEKKD